MLAKCEELVESLRYEEPPEPEEPLLELPPAKKRFAGRWAEDEEASLKELVKELGDNQWDQVAERLGTGRSARGAEQHWEVMRGTHAVARKRKGPPPKAPPKRSPKVPPTVPLPDAAAVLRRREATLIAYKAGRSNACEVRRVGEEWRRFERQTDACRAFPDLSQGDLSRLINDSPDCSPALRLRFEARRVGAASPVPVEEADGATIDVFDDAAAIRAAMEHCVARVAKQDDEPSAAALAWAARQPADSTAAKAISGLGVAKEAEDAAKEAEVAAAARVASLPLPPWGYNPFTDGPWGDARRRVPRGGV